MANEEITQPTVREALEEHIAAANVETPANDAPAETDAQATERLRDEAGRFAKTESKPALKISTAAPAEADKPAPLLDATTQTAAPAVEPIPRPSSWKKEMWGVWDKLATGGVLTPQEARQVAEYNAQREQQFASGVSTYKQEAERAKPIMDALAPFQGELQRINTSAPQMVHELMSAHNTLANGSPQEKLQLFSKLMQNYGVPMNAFFDQGAQQQYLQSAPQRQIQQQPQQNIPQIIEQVLQQREATQTVTQMERDTQKYPFLQYVRGTMAQLLESGVTTDLDEAYQQSMQAPEHSMLTTFLQQQQAKDEEQRKIEAQQKAAKVARANQVSTRSATPASSGAVNGKPSVREAIQASIDAISGSARV